jgi:hypothetical protein
MMPPEKLFKFVASPDAVKNITQGRLKFTPVRELNDPSELLPAFRDEVVRRSLDQLRLQGHSPTQFAWLLHQAAVLQKLSPASMAIRVPKTIEEANRIVQSGFFDNFPEMHRRLIKAVEQIKEGVGVLSLSGRYDSLPMWAHYAGQGTGYVVEFTKLSELFPGDETGSLNQIKRVAYEDEPIGMTFDPCTQDNLFFKKFSDWSYEREWRVILALSDCERPPLFNLFLKQIDPSHVTRVVAGWNAEPAVLGDLKSFLDANCPHVEFVVAELASGKVAVN